MNRRNLLRALALAPLAGAAAAALPAPEPAKPPATDFRLSPEAREAWGRDLYLEMARSKKATATYSALAAATMASMNLSEALHR